MVFFIFGLTRVRFSFFGGHLSKKFGERGNMVIFSLNSSIFKIRTGGT